MRNQYDKRPSSLAPEPRRPKAGVDERRSAPGDQDVSVPFKKQRVRARRCGGAKKRRTEITSFGGMVLFVSLAPSHPCCPAFVQRVRRGRVCSSNSGAGGGVPF